MDCIRLTSESPYVLLLNAAFLIPIAHYVLAFLFLLSLFLYNFVEMYFIQELFTAFRGQRVSLTFNSSCDLYQEVVSRCKMLHGRFSSTPWLCSPHLQTVFLQLFERIPACNYQRQIFKTTDGGTIALDWLLNVDVKKPFKEGSDGVPSDDKTPIILVIPGLTSDSNSAYVKHLAFKMNKSGWNVVVSNHRGLGGLSITSDCLYNAGWTEDVREIIGHLHTQYPQAPLFAVGTSIGANVLVKYLGEEGVNTAIVGAVAICSPWDLLIGDRFIKRKLVQRPYDRALGIGLKDYVMLHRSILPRLTDWKSISKISCIRDYDKHVTCVLANFETVDTYYRKVSCSSYILNVRVPLLCISALDDPVCSKETIPWDECRANKNVVLATTQHGGHLGHIEGMMAKSLWWVRAADEFLCVLNSSSLIHREKIQNTIVDSPLKSIDQAPYVSIREDGLVTAFSNDTSDEIGNEQLAKDDKAGDGIRVDNGTVRQEPNATTQFDPVRVPNINAVMVPVKNCLNQLSRCSIHLHHGFAVLIFRLPLCTSLEGHPFATTEVEKPSIERLDGVQRDDKSPILLVIPGLTSDSYSASDRFYNAAWTEDIRKVIDHLHTQYHQAPLFVVGLSFGANLLVKYLGEEGFNTAIAGAAAVCSPWDLLICDRFMNRRLVQKFYNRALTIGLKDYAKLHQTVMSRLADWEGIVKVPSDKWVRYKRCQKGKVLVRYLVGTHSFKRAIAASMADTNATASTEAITIDHHHPLHLQASDMPGLVIIPIKLTGPENYALWSRSMKLALRGKGKLGFIDGSCVKNSYRGELTELWEKGDAIVFSWIGCTEASELIPSILFASNAKQVWKDFKERFDRSNLTRIYHLWTEIATLRQGMDSVTCYHSKMKDCWDELDVMVALPHCDCAESRFYVEHL
ncbi:putative embryogenesis-associated protein EMB8-like [Capsicum annuum]|nr:putative embryogenesis-associated protein EMB8-like [Capsicum annuum]